VSRFVVSGGPPPSARMSPAGNVIPAPAALPRGRRCRSYGTDRGPHSANRSAHLKPICREMTYPLRGRPANPVRLCVARQFGSDIDGAWWPRGDRITNELPKLVAALILLLGNITSINVNWPPLQRPPCPRRLKNDPVSTLELTRRKGVNIRPPLTRPTSTGQETLCRAAIESSAKTIWLLADPSRELRRARCLGYIEKERSYQQKFIDLEEQIFEKREDTERDADYESFQRHREEYDQRQAAITALSQEARQKPARSSEKDRGVVSEVDRRKPATRCC